MTNDKFVLVPVELLKNILPTVSGTEYEEKLKKLLSSREAIENNNVTKLPKKAIVKKVIDGDTVELNSGLILRYVGITAPETGEPFEKESTLANKQLVEGKEISLEYDNYKSDKFGRILAYAICNGKNISVELAKLGLAELVIYQKRKPFIHQQELLKVQQIAQTKKLGVWKNKN